MPVVLVIGIIAILVGVFVVATGRGGELAYEHADHAPLDLGPVAATDVALLRPPTALWGYNMQVTDEALDRIARALRDRDIEIAFLQRQLADLGHGQLQAGERESWYAKQLRPDFVPGHERPSLADEPPTEVQPSAPGTEEFEEARETQPVPVAFDTDVAYDTDGAFEPDQASEPAPEHTESAEQTQQTEHTEHDEHAEHDEHGQDNDEAAAEEQGW